MIRFNFQQSCRLCRGWSTSSSSFIMDFQWAFIFYRETHARKQVQVHRQVHLKFWTLTTLKCPFGCLFSQFSPLWNFYLQVHLHLQCTDPSFAKEGRILDLRVLKDHGELRQQGPQPGARQVRGHCHHWRREGGGYRRQRLSHHLRY